MPRHPRVPAVTMVLGGRLCTFRRTLDAGGASRRHAETHQKVRLREHRDFRRPAQYDFKDTRALLKNTAFRCWGAVTLTLGERNLAAKDEGPASKVGGLREECYNDGE